MKKDPEIPQWLILLAAALCVIELGLGVIGVLETARRLGGYP